MIRPAKWEDRESIWEVHKSAILRLCASYYTEGEVRAWVSTISPTSYESSILDTGKSVLVAEQKDEVVGFAQIDFKNQEIEAVYVSPGIAGEGIGKNLLKTTGITRKTK